MNPFPVEMMEYRQWIIWKSVPVNGRMTKVPINPNTGYKASCTNPEHWAYFQNAQAALYKYKADGLGFVFTENDPFCGIDIDDAFQNDEKRILTGKIVARLNSYTEWSPSHKGLHVIVKAKLQDCRHPKGIGMFDRNRYFTMTGLRIKTPCQQAESRQHEVDKIFRYFFPDAQAAPMAPAPRKEYPRHGSSDAEVLRKAFNAKNGAKFERVWNGDLTEFDGDWSRADAYLLGRLAYWTDRNKEQAFRLFKQSTLFRSKFFSRRPIYGSYANQTWAKVIGSSF